MSADHDVAFLDWIERAKTADIKEVADRLGARLRKAGVAEMVGPCPLCGGKDRFSVNQDAMIRLIGWAGSYEPHAGETLH